MREHWTERYILVVYYLPLPAQVCVSGAMMRVFPDEYVDVLMGWPGKGWIEENTCFTFIFHVFVIASEPS